MKYTYQESTKWLYETLPMFTKIGKIAYNPGLENITKMVSLLNNPQDKYKTIHVAGTNGKGSVSHMLASVLQEQGYKVGLFTSPHLISFTERIRVKGVECQQDFVVNFIEKHKEYAQMQKLSFFEFTTAMAFEYFKEKKVDYAVIEVGLGGRLDATNIITPILSVINNIHFDHQDILGNTIEKIAFEKGGIIKPFIPVVLGEMLVEANVALKKIAKEKNARIFEYQNQLNENNYQLDLKGLYQQKNIKTVLTALNVLVNELNIKISEEAIKQGLLHVVKNTGLRGRWEELGENPKIICDTAHNTDGITQIVEQIKQQKFNNLHLVLGFLKDKDFKKIIELFPKNATYYFCEPNSERKLTVDEIKKIVNNRLNATYHKTPKEALEKAKNNANSLDFIYVGGSNFIVSEILA